MGKYTNEIFLMHWLDGKIAQGALVEFWHGPQGYQVCMHRHIMGCGPTMYDAIGDAKRIIDALERKDPQAFTDVIATPIADDEPREPWQGG